MASYGSPQFDPGHQPCTVFPLQQEGYLLESGSLTDDVLVLCSSQSSGSMQHYC